jgi:hypothetical protein
MVSEKNTTLAVFNGVVFNASIKVIEFKKPKIKLKAKIAHFLEVLFSSRAAYLNPTLVKILNKTAAQSQILFIVYNLSDEDSYYLNCLQFS